MMEVASTANDGHRYKRIKVGFSLLQRVFETVFTETVPAEGLSSSRRVRAVARLLALLGSVLFIGLAIEGVTIVFIGQMISIHVVLGMIFLPIMAGLQDHHGHLPFCDLLPGSPRLQARWSSRASPSRHRTAPGDHNRGAHGEWHRLVVRKARYTNGCLLAQHPSG